MATIREILTGVKAGTIDPSSAEAQIQQQIEAAVDKVDCRSRYASAVLQGNIAAGKVYPSRKAMAKECLGMADALLEAQQGLGQ